MSAAAPATSPAKIPKPILEPHLNPIYILTVSFGVIFLLGLIMVPKGPNAGVIRTCVSLSAFCMWLFWVTVYIAQMNPILGPKMENTTLGWISRKWGIVMTTETTATSKVRAMPNIGPPGI